jgi:hypothetical protein
MNARRSLQSHVVDDHEELLFTELALFNRKLADWLVFYNTERPHHTLGQRSPLSFLLQHQPECQRCWTHTKLFEPSPVDQVCFQNCCICCMRRFCSTDT